MKKESLLLPLLLIIGGSCKKKEKNEIAHYRTSFIHVKTMVLQEGHPLFDAFGGIHHVYANFIAYKALKNNRFPFPDGSILIFDLLEKKEENHALVEGKRKVLAYMRKNSLKYKETGGWEFQAFLEGDLKKPIVKDPKKECFSCHLSQKKRDYVFSSYRE